MRPDRGVDTPWNRRMFPRRLGEGLAHAVQTLKLICFALAGHGQYRRDGQRIMRGELRKEAGHVEQLSRAGNVIDVGHRLAREHGIVGEAALLRALDLAVPIGALHQPHGESAIIRPR